MSNLDVWYDDRGNTEDHHESDGCEGSHSLPSQEPSPGLLLLICFAFGFIQAFLSVAPLHRVQSATYAGGVGRRGDRDCVPAFACLSFPSFLVFAHQGKRLTYLLAAEIQAGKATPQGIQ